MGSAWSIIGWNSSSGPDRNSSQFIPRGKFGNPGSVEGGDFDSHIIFAAAHPIPVESAIRVYYMGGNGPHNGPRNSSLGLATLRHDGFVAVGGTGVFSTSQPI